MKPEIIYESTPNPNALKFMITNQVICDRQVFFSQESEASLSPLAKKLFAFPWLESILLSPQFITIVKKDWVDWTVLADPLVDLLSEHLERGEPVLLPGAGSLSPTPNAKTPADAADSDVVRQIKELLDREIRPAVAADGGDVTYYNYSDGKLYLRLQGACSTCPSAQMTLKDGIESRFREAFPEINEVLSI